MSLTLGDLGDAAIEESDGVLEDDMFLMVLVIGVRRDKVLSGRLRMR